MSTKQIQIIVPCYNEEKRLETEKILSFAESYPNAHFIFVDDGSRDRTAVILQKLRKVMPRQIDVLQLQENCGKAEAVRRGFLHAIDDQAPYIAFWDADLATPLGAIPEFLGILEENPQIDMVLGARVKLMGRDIRRHAHRHYLGRVFATVTSLVLGLKIYDTQCGAKVFRKSETLRQIIEKPFCSKWIFDVELLARYLKAKKELGVTDFDTLIYEHPLLVWHDIAGSKVKPWDFFIAFSELARIHWTYRPSNRYEVQRSLTDSIRTKYQYLPTRNRESKIKK